MDTNELTYKVRGAIFQVHNTLGPGLFENVYEAALAYELNKNGLFVQTQLGVPVKYGEIKLDLGFRIDILVEDAVLIEIKSVEVLHNIHKKQLLNYLKLTGKKIGILVNFNTTSLIDKETLIRIAN